MSNELKSSLISIVLLSGLLASLALFGFPNTWWKLIIFSFIAFLIIDYSETKGKE